MFDKSVPDSIKRCLTTNKKWVLYHFIFCKGIGNFNRSTLKTVLLKDSLVEVELKKWCYYKSNGVKIMSINSYNTRLKEIELWKRN